jgi:hypothetical protein
MQCRVARNLRFPTYPHQSIPINLPYHGCAERILVPLVNGCEGVVCDSEPPTQADLPAALGQRACELKPSYNHVKSEQSAFRFLQKRDINQTITYFAT